VLSKASISNANNPESLWSLNASRVWLLPGSDFAIFNAVLKVGEIPVMYIPFFYYPADEVIFHPVIGFRTREGNFVQTSTYILGRPRANSTSQSSLTKILGNSSDMEKKREGLFLRSTGKKAVDPGAVTLKAIVDYYANLGGYFGTDLTMPKAGILGTTDISLGIGVSRTIVNLGSSSYSPFAPNYDGTSDWNSSNLFSMDVPFRYRFKMSSSLSGKYGSLSWNIPYYSDPYMDRDFLNRAEEMDWVNMIQKGAAVEAEETSENLVSSYNWQLSGSVNPRFPNMSPYISGISISGISSNISFKTKTLPTTHPNYNKDSPMRLFYYPDTYTIYSVSGSISGTPLTLGASKPAPSNTAKPAEPAKPEDDPLKGIGVPRPPWESAAEKTAKKDDAADKLVPPVLSQRFDIRRVGNVQFSMNYRLSPTGASELQFRSSKWQEYSDIDWGEVRSVLSTVGGDASTGLSLNHSDGLFTNSFTYSGNGSWRQYSYLNEEAEDYLTNGNPDPDKVSAARKQQYGQSAFSTSYSLSSSLKPLYRSTVWGSSGIQYSLSGLAVKSVFDQTSTGEDPKWDLEYADWTKEKITTHQFSANIAASIMEKTQNLTLSADLPPKDSALSWNAAFRVWISETSANMRILFPGEADKRKLEPFYTTETLKFGSFGTLTHYMVLDTELKELTTVTSSLSLSKWGLSASYAAVRMLGYEFISGTGTGTGWVQKTGDQTLQSRDFSLTYAKTFSQKDLWNKRLNFSVNLNSRLFFDLQRYTSSSFSFSLGFTLGINKFVDLSLSATSENAAIYWYLKDLPMFADLPPELHDGEYNLFTDLINSFRFDNDDLRRSSAFKMKTFRLTATHHMGDWNAVLGITMSPYRPTNSLKYEINNEISFLIQWLPISEIKSDMSYSKRTDIWTVK
jgi:hypothetical protein